MKGPGYVRMGAGYETFASGLTPATKVGSPEVVSPVPILRQVVREESRANVQVDVRVVPKRGMEGIEHFFDIMVDKRIGPGLDRAIARAGG